MSRTAAKYNMTVVRGSTWEDEFTYTDDAGVAIDLTGYEARLQVRSAAGQYGTSTTDTLILELSTTGADPQLLWDTAAQGRLRIRVEAEDTAVLNPTNVAKARLVYALEIYQPPAGADPEYVIPFVQGRLSVLGETVR
jgi:hypothetical protein